MILFMMSLNKKTFSHCLGHYFHSIHVSFRLSLLKHMAFSLGRSTASTGWTIWPAKRHMAAQALVRAVYLLLCSFFIMQSTSECPVNVLEDALGNLLVSSLSERSQAQSAFPTPKLLNPQGCHRDRVMRASSFHLTQRLGRMRVKTPRSCISCLLPLACR